MPGQALADRADSGNTSQGRAPVSAGQVDLTKPAEVITNYQQPGAPQVPAAEEPQPLPEVQETVSEPRIVKKKQGITKRKRRSSVASRSTRKGAPQAWWDDEGSQLVQTLRDCVVRYATGIDGPRTGHAMRQIIANAIDTDCRADFDAMAEQIARRLGEDRFREISTELVADLLSSQLQQDQAVNQAATDG